MRVFLAGSTGVVGSRLLPMLVAAGHQVTALTRRPDRVAALAAAGAEPVVADALDAAALAAAVVAAAPEVVLHQLTDLTDLDFAANSAVREIGTRNLVDAARAAGVRRVVAQSIAWAYEPGSGPATENTPLDLHSEGSRLRTVRAVDTLERVVREAPEWVVLRYGMFYGPGTWFATGGLRAEEATAGRLPATADVTSFVHVDDAASAAVAALTWPSGPVNVCDDEPAAGTDWVPTFCKAVGAPPPPAATAPRAGWARGADNRYARERLGWAPAHPTWRTGFTSPGAHVVPALPPKTYGR